MRPETVARFFGHAIATTSRWLHSNKGYTTRMLRRKEYLYNVGKFREKLKQRSSNGRPSSTASLQVIGSGAPGEPTCLCLLTDKVKYIFNCGEGTQRLSNEHKMKLSKTTHIFVTSATWKNLGGLPGMLLTLQDIGVPKIKLHAPEGTMELFKAITKFVCLQTLEVENAGTKEYENSTVKIWSVPISKSSETNGAASIKFKEKGEEQNARSTDCQQSTEQINFNGKRLHEEDKRLDNKKRMLTVNDTRISTIMSYICKVWGLPGTLQVEKCLEKGVTPGPQLGELKAGKDITLPDGTVVKSEDVCSQKVPDSYFLVVECPSEEYLENFVNNSALAKHQASATLEEERASAVVHFTPEKIFNNPKYREWMDKFSTRTRHVVLNDGNRCLGSERIHRIQHELHLLHSEIFPFLNEEGFKDEEKEGEHPLIHRARTCHLIDMRRKFYLDTSKEVVLFPQEYVKQLFEIEGFLDALAELQTEVNAQTKLLHMAEYPKIVMLGTGSSIPSKTRNTSAILLWIDEKHSVLLDCGEGTAHQIRRFYGNKKFGEVLNSIKAIYISHLHADHHLGIVEILQNRAMVTDEPVYILAPTFMLSWLKFYDSQFEPIMQTIKSVNNRNIIFDDRQITSVVINEIQQSLNVQKVETVYVDHCSNSFGVAVTLHNGQKIVYSGDTRPCSRLVDLGLDCDLLIHEATMEDHMLDEADAKLHSTTTQAIKIGQSMRAKQILLTHFSQRYAKIVYLPTDREDVNLSNVGIAYDNMQISLSQFPLLPLFYPTLKIMYHEYYERIEKKTEKRMGHRSP